MLVHLFICNLNLEVKSSSPPEDEKFVVEFFVLKWWLHPQVRVSYLLLRLSFKIKYVVVNVLGVVSKMCRNRNPPSSL